MVIFFWKFSKHALTRRRGNCYNHFSEKNVFYCFWKILCPPIITMHWLQDRALIKQARDKVSSFECFSCFLRSKIEHPWKWMDRKGLTSNAQHLWSVGWTRPSGRLFPENVSKYRYTNAPYSEKFVTSACFVSINGSSMRLKDQYCEAAASKISSRRNTGSYTHGTLYHNLWDLLMVQLVRCHTFFTPN